MPREFWRSINDLVVMLSARPIALPLIALLLFKLYQLHSAALIYALGLLLLAVVFTMRWCIRLLAAQKLNFLMIKRGEDRS